MPDKTFENKEPKVSENELWDFDEWMEHLSEAPADELSESQPSKMPKENPVFYESDKELQANAAEKDDRSKEKTIEEKDDGVQSRTRTFLSNVASKIKNFIKGAVGVVASIGSRILLGREVFVREYEKNQARERDKIIAAHDAKKQEEKVKEQKSEPAKEHPEEKSNAVLALSPELERRILMNIQKAFPERKVIVNEAQELNHKDSVSISLSDPENEKFSIKAFIDSHGNVTIDEKSDVLGEENAPTDPTLSSDFATQQEVFVDVIKASIYEHDVNRYLDATLGECNSIGFTVSHEIEDLTHAGELKIEAINKDTLEKEYDVYIDKNGNVTNLDSDNEIVAQNKQVIAAAVRDYDYKALGIDAVPSSEKLEKDIADAMEKIQNGEESVKFAYQGVDFNIHKTDDNFVVAEATHTSLSGEVVTVACEGPAPADSQLFTEPSTVNNFREAIINTMACSSKEFTSNFMESPSQDEIGIDNGDGNEYYGYVPEDERNISFDEQLQRDTELDRLHEELNDPDLKDFTDANEYDDNDELSLFD